MNRHLIALACGDSYGSFFEPHGLMGEEFDINFLPDTPIRARITDDTKMAQILLNHYYKLDDIDEELLFKEYQTWALLCGDEDGIGLHTKDVLLNDQTNKDSQGNGALMRVIPLGLELYERGVSFVDCVNTMNKDSFLTHKNETISLSNELVLDIAINGVEVINKNKYSSITNRLEQGYTAWIIHTLHVVIQALQYELNFLDGFKYITSCGGDTDTNCAIFGAIRSYRFDIRNEINVGEFLTEGIGLKFKLNY